MDKIRVLFAVNTHVVAVVVGVVVVVVVVIIIVVVVFVAVVVVFVIFFVSPNYTIELRVFVSDAVATILTVH